MREDIHLPQVRPCGRHARHAPEDDGMIEGGCMIIVDAGHVLLDIFKRTRVLRSAVHVLVDVTSQTWRPSHAWVARSASFVPSLTPVTDVNRYGWRRRRYRPAVGWTFLYSHTHILTHRLQHTKHTHSVPKGFFPTSPQCRHG